MTYDDLIERAINLVSIEKIEKEFNLKPGYISNRKDLLDLYNHNYYVGQVRKEKREHFTSLHDAKMGAGQFTIPGGGPGFVMGWKK